MQTLNQILVQLRESDRFARALNPHFRRLAVVLLDNIVELQLRRKAEKAFAWDRTTWYSGVRKYNDKLRAQVFRSHPKLLDFAEQEGWITPSESRLIDYAHHVRNEFYHEGKYDDLDAEIAIRLLYGLIKARFPDWRTAQSVIFISPNMPIRVEDAANDRSGHSPMLLGIGKKSTSLLGYNAGTDSDSYWHEALDCVLAYRGKRKTTRLIYDKIIAYIRYVERKVRFIRTDGEGINFFDVLSHRFHTLTPAFSNEILAGHALHDYKIAIGVCEALLPEEERLLDIEDPIQRFNESQKLIEARKRNVELVSRTKMAEFRKRANAVLKADEATGIEAFLSIEKELAPAATVVGELASTLEIYIQFRVDEALGK